MMLARRLLGHQIYDILPAWSNVELLINPGTVGSTTHVDATGTHTLSNEGTAPVVSDAMGRPTIMFANGAIRAGDPFSFLNDGSTPWTVDLELYRTSDTTYQSFMSNTINDTLSVYKYIQFLLYGSTSDLLNVSLGKTPSAPYFFASGGNNSAPLNTWLKIRVRYDGVTLGIFTDGVLTATMDKPVGFEPGTDVKTTNLCIGRFPTGSYPFGGHVGGIRIVRGEALPGENVFSTPFPTS